MPELSRFYGIIIRMFSEPTERHHVPHFHAYYQEHIAIFSVEPVELIAGSVPHGNSGWLKHGLSFTSMN